MRYRSLNDVELLKKISVADAKAFVVIFERYKNHVYAFSLSILKNPEAAQDVVQDVMLKLWQMGDRLLEIKNLEAWLKVASRNRTIDFLRAEKSRLLIYEEDAEVKDLGHDDTQQQILYRDLQNTLRSAMLILSTQQHKVYQLMDIEGFDSREVAKALGLTRSTVLTHLKIARRKLRAYMLHHADMIVLLTLLSFI